MTWLIAIGGGTALVAAIYLSIKIVALSREYATKLSNVHTATDKALSIARTELSDARTAQHDAEREREDLRRNANATTLALEAARLQLDKERRTNARMRERAAELQRIIDEASTPSDVRDRLRRLLSADPTSHVP